MPDIDAKLGMLMIGPRFQGLGGISRVAYLWQRSGLFKNNSITYLPSVNDGGRNKFILLLKCLAVFLVKLPFYRFIYIHTASFNSFYRKSFFLFLAVLFRKKIILHIHPSYFYLFITAFSGVKKKFFFWLLSQVDSFVVLTEDMQQKINTLFPGKPVYVLHNPVDVNAMGVPGKAEREKAKLLFLGWFNREKGVYDLVDAAQILVVEGVDFIIDFYGTKEIEQLRKYVSERKLDAFIKVHGWANENQKLEALHHSTALVLPSHTEGIPNVILEAMAAKIPIISTLVGGLAEILRDGENAIIVEPGNPCDLAEKIRFVLNNQSYCNDLVEKAYMEACEKYDLPVIKAQFQKILAAVMA